MISLANARPRALAPDRFSYQIGQAHADFGALPLSTEGSTGHSSYFKAESLRNLTRIMLGQYDAVVVDR